MEGSVSLEDFKKLRLRIAKILQAEDIAGADRLWKLTIDSGSGAKTIVAGIKKSYPDKASLLGRSLVVVDNLEPAVIRGVESHGMLLAAKAGESLSLIAPDQDTLPAGSSVG